jgi:hypothetical protein
MPPQTKRRQLKWPKNRGRGSREGYFFPNEVLEILDLKGLGYRQLRRLFGLVRASRGGVQPGKWARFTFQDLIALRGAVQALGGPRAVLAAKRLQLKRLEAACEHLRRVHGLTEPLTQARWVSEGDHAVVQLLGARFEPDTGQLLLGLSRRVDEHLELTQATAGVRHAVRERVVHDTFVVRRHGAKRLRFFARRAVASARLRFGKAR